MTGPAKDSDNPLDRLAAEEDWSRRARAIEKEAAKQLRQSRRGRLRVPRPRTPRERHGISPLFIALVALTVAAGTLVWFGIGPVSVMVFAFAVCAWLVSVTLHEFAHALTAHRGGDDTIAARGYLNLDLRKYGHPLLTFGLPFISLLLGGIPLPGAAVLVDSHRLRNRWRDSLVSIAGPSVNVIAAIVLLAVVGLAGPDGIYSLAAPHAAFWSALTFIAWLMVVSSVLNLIPIPPLDGYGIIEPYLGYETRRFGNAIKPWGFFVVFGLLYLPPVRTAFGDLTSGIMDLASSPVNGVYYGYQLFQFWK